jgi:hypothetical protein
MKPTRDRPELSTATVLSISSLPRPTSPSRFTRSYSEARVRRRCFGNESELKRFISVVDSLPYAEECWRAELCDANAGLAKFAPKLRTSICTAKVFSLKISGEDFAKKESQSLRSRRGLSRRFGCRRRRFRRGRRRFCCRSCCSCWRTRGCRACRGFGCLGLLLARRKERGTGQNADVFFHSVNWKRHIALTD